MPSNFPYQVIGSRLGGTIKTLDTWFDDVPSSLSGIDLWICHRRSTPLNANRWMYFYTILVDLTLTPEAILNQMNKTTIKEIKQARDKYRLKCTFNDSPTHVDIDEFSSFFDAHPRSKEQLPIDRELLVKMNNVGLIQISKIKMENGTDLVWRCNFTHRTQQRVQPIFAPSLHHIIQDRDMISLVGRANRLLYYNEMLHFKDQGYLIYDFNGWYAGIEDKKRLQINQFKEGFGGRIVYGYDCEEPLTLRGKIYLRLRSIKQILFQPHVVREIKRRRQKAPSLFESPTL